MGHQLAGGGPAPAEAIEDAQRPGRVTAVFAPVRMRERQVGPDRARHRRARLGQEGSGGVPAVTPTRDRCALGSASVNCAGWPLMPPWTAAIWLGEPIRARWSSVSSSRPYSTCVCLEVAERRLAART